MQKNEISTEVVEAQQKFELVNLDSGVLPDLSDAKEIPFDLMSDYWTPDKEGESKRLIFDSIRTRLVRDMQTDDTLELDCAFFFEQVNGQVKTVCNGSKRLVGVIESYKIQRGTALLITYMGKKRNKSNSFLSDIWSVRPLIINVKSK